MRVNLQNKMIYPEVYETSIIVFPCPKENVYSRNLINTEFGSEIDLKYTHDLLEANTICSKYQNK